MEWKGRRGSQNIEDRRGQPRARGVRAGGVGGVGMIAVLLIGWYLGVDLTPLLQGQGGGGTVSGPPAEVTEADRERGQFTSVALQYTEEVWTQVFREQVDGEYQPVTLVLFKESTTSDCGVAGAASGPFYCPADKKVYLDTDFFVTLDQRLGAGGDFAAAYVVAHEVAHHIQDLLGTLGQVNAQRARVSEEESNQLSVRIELQADCYSGIWARLAEKWLGVVEPGDFDEALNAAQSIGDDVLQRGAGRRPMPHTFTHGTAEQRGRWFQTGYKTGQLAACDTFATDRL
ncbi:MAG: KPN_02809 family neutral zinc metallopeptidase [Gemmobacter sp.]